MSKADNSTLEKFIEDSLLSGGAETANYQLFVVGLCEALGLDRPQMAQESNELNDYVFQRRVDFKHGDGTRTPGFIDCYKRDCFILEAKQSAKRQAQNKKNNELILKTEDMKQPKLGHAKRGTSGWDQLMNAARQQAVNYSSALPVEHGYPPFLLIVDVGNVIEVFADFSGQGKNYAHYPDRQNYRIELAHLRENEIQQRLIAIWNSPLSLDPSNIATEVTKDIADSLAKIAKKLEKQHDPKDVAEFLMRCLFTMFAEGVGLIPEKSFRDLLHRMKDTPLNFTDALAGLWTKMDLGGYSEGINARVRRFNGALFKNRTALPLDAADIAELWAAARKDWSNVEPAIFGTLVERALNPLERAKLGAHYTPRAYVERLVVPTIIDPLRMDWEEVQARSNDLQTTGDLKGALAVVRAFHRKLCTTKVLDPACGTGNFLYVCLELMKRLEGEVLKAISDLGGQPDRYSDYPKDAGGGIVGQRLARTGGRFTVDPHQFYGLETNIRAVPIADLVLWIGYLKWQLKTNGINSIQEPVLDAYGTIVHQDAILDYSSRDIALNDAGQEITIWDGTTHVRSPVSGQLVPDPNSRQITYRYANPKPAEWPKVDFVIGNPPFIGNKLLRRRLGNGYVDALYQAYSDLPNSFDFVTYWWARAADLLKRGKIRGFGFVTTKTLSQVSNRGAIADLLASKRGALTFAIPNHPWVDTANAAAVRVAFTSASRTKAPGTLFEITKEKKTNRAELPSVEFKKTRGIVHSNLAMGVDTTKVTALKANDGMSFQGCKLGHDDFQVDASLADQLKASSDVGGAYVRKYVGGDQIKDGAEPGYAIDLYGLSEDYVKEEFPAAYQHLTDRVKPFKDEVRRDSHRNRWWIFGEPRPELRDALSGLTKYIATVEVSKHRYFVFQDWPEVLVDGSVVAITSDDPALFAVLHSRLHVYWSLQLGGRMGVGNDPRYQNSVVFDPFPFPAALDAKKRASIPLLQRQYDRLRRLGVLLHVFRSRRLASSNSLTMTKMYNVLELLREIAFEELNGVDELQAGPRKALTDDERAIYTKGVVSRLRALHDQIDAEVFSAYGWEDLKLPLLGKPGGTLPSNLKTPGQEEAEREMLARLVQLNTERAQLESDGAISWLRGEINDASGVEKARKVISDRKALPAEKDTPLDSKPEWPKDGLDQFTAVRDILAEAQAPMAVRSVVSKFSGKKSDARQARVEKVLETLAMTGVARIEDFQDHRRYFLPS